MVTSLIAVKGKGTLRILPCGTSFGIKWWEESWSWILTGILVIVYWGYVQVNGDVINSCQGERAAPHLALRNAIFDQMMRRELVLNLDCKFSNSLRRSRGSKWWLPSTAIKEKMMLPILPWDTSVWIKWYEESWFWILTGNLAIVQRDYVEVNGDVISCY